MIQEPPDDLLLIDEANGHVVKGNRVNFNSFDGIAVFRSEDNRIVANQADHNGFLTLNKTERVIDFETDAQGNPLAAGEIIADQFVEFGLTVSTRTGHRWWRPSLPAMIFDTNNPTGDDFDLSFTDQGNALIISEDGDTLDPDDNADGGALIFDFASPVFVRSVDLLDVEEYGGFIQAFDLYGNRIDVVPIYPTGNNTAQTIDISAFGASKLKIHLAGSAAIDDLIFSTLEQSDPVGVGIGLFDSSNNVVRSNETNDNGLYGIAVARSENNRINHNKVLSNGSDGIYLEDASFNHLLANYVKHNQGNGVAVVDTEEVDLVSTGNEIKNNVFKKNGLNGILLTGGSNHEVANNSVFANGKLGLENQNDGIRLENVSNGNVRNNWSMFNDGFGISLNDSNENEIRNNHLFGNGEGAIFESGDSTDNNIKNNRDRWWPFW